MGLASLERHMPGICHGLGGGGGGAIRGALIWPFARIWVMAPRAPPWWNELVRTALGANARQRGGDMG